MKKVNDLRIIEITEGKTPAGWMYSIGGVPFLCSPDRESKARVIDIARDYVGVFRSLGRKFKIVKI